MSHWPAAVLFSTFILPWLPSRPHCQLASLQAQQQSALVTDMGPAGVIMGSPPPQNPALC